MATALIAFVQGPNSAPAGEAVAGTLFSVDGNVTVSNGDDTGVVSWKFEILYVPPTSGTGLATQGPGPTATFVFPPDVAGSYRIQLTVRDGAGVANIDIRNFCVPFPVFGLIAPPYQRNPAPLALTGAGGKPDEMNISGQAFGWDGDEVTSRKLLFQALLFLDGLTSSGEINTASNVGAGDGVFKVKAGVDLEFKSLIAGTNITLTPGTNDITIDAATGTGEANLVANVGSGDGWFRDKTGVTFNLKSITTTDTSLTVTSSANELDIKTTLAVGRSTPSLSFSHSSSITLTGVPKSPAWSTAFHPSVDTAVFTYPKVGSISADEVEVLVKGMYRLHAGAVAELDSGTYYNPGVAFYKAGVLIAGTESSTSGDDCVNLQGYTDTVEVELLANDVVTPGWHRFSGNTTLIALRTHFSIQLVRTT